MALKATAFAGLYGIVAACSVAEPLVVRSTLDAPAANTAQIAMAMPKGQDTAPIGQFANALVNSFENRGMVVAEDGALLADYGLAETPATIGVERTPTDISADDAVWISPARPAKRFDECEALELRGTLLLINRESGDVAYRSKAKAVDCEFGAAMIEAMADALVADFVSKSAR